MPTSRYLRPDFIIAFLAVIIGLCTMFVYIYQAKIMSRQMHAAAWPYLEIASSNSSSQFSIDVHNRGAGPAIIKDAYITLDSVRYQDSQKNVDSVTYLLTGSRTILSGYSNINTRVMSPGDVIKFIEVTDSTSVKLLLQALAKYTVQITICYCSVYDECWKVTGSKVEPCENCQ